MQAGSGHEKTSSSIAWPFTTLCGAITRLLHAKTSSMHSWSVYEFAYLYLAR